jgi:hypothetical protein
MSQPLDCRFLTCPCIVGPPAICSGGSNELPQTHNVFDATAFRLGVNMFCMLHRNFSWRGSQGYNISSTFNRGFAWMLENRNAVDKQKFKE